MESEKKGSFPSFAPTIPPEAKRYERLNRLIMGAVFAVLRSNCDCDVCGKVRKIAKEFEELFSEE